MGGERASREHVHRNRARWDVEARDYVAAGERAWAREEPTWGIWRVPESQLRILPASLASKSAIELGAPACGPIPIAGFPRRRASCAGAAS